ncbi:carbon-nitrogen hydrolase family protein [Paenibacillus koleovorans]|uniref:carbon-nitrogen hydrolase family protein n=1 Tax=Paenibacillus koleovorans TaxID=121608 RepID=UPI0013E3A01A|nr:carbon-nitrogen hydrolase family protein [Paenibacillus koleovorans]
MGKQPKLKQQKTSTVSAVQFTIGPLQSESAFWTKVRTYISRACYLGSRLIVFPEYLTGQLLSLHPPATNAEACEIMHGYTETYKRQFAGWSRETGMMILAGTHIHREGAPTNDGSALHYYNEAFLFLPDGRLHRHKKVHLTPEEQRTWPLLAGDRFETIDTPLGRVGIQICYDIEFPEGVRLQADQGAELILCPSYTDAAAGYYRVRHCSQARAVENQLYVALSGLVGQMPGVAQVDEGYCQAGIFAPCDRPFPPNGVLAQGPVNRSGLATAAADLEKLRYNRTEGAVAPFYDRRPELYRQAAAAHTSQ